MNYLLSSWEDRSKATAIDAFKVDLKLNKDIRKSASVQGAVSVSRK